MGQHNYHVKVLVSYVIWEVVDYCQTNKSDDELHDHLHDENDRDGHDAYKKH